jgi:hypothetical protein
VGRVTAGEGISSLRVFLCTGEPKGLQSLVSSGSRGVLPIKTSCTCHLVGSCLGSGNGSGWVGFVRA